MPLLTELLGRDVVDVSGRVAGRVVDLAVDLGEPTPEIVHLLVRNGRRGAVREVPWGAVVDLGPPVRLRVDAESHVAEPARRGELLLAAHVLDRQIFDGRGLRLRRVCDVDLAAADGRLRMSAVEVGIGTLLRRLGLGRVARRIKAEVVDWPDLHLVSGPGHGLQLRSGAAGVHRLDVEQLAALAARLPVERASELLDATDPARAQAASALATHFRHRRRRGPLHLRRRAPS